MLCDYEELVFWVALICLCVSYLVFGNFKNKGKK